MKVIIRGRAYNTETAQLVCDLSYGYRGTSFSWHETQLYQTRNGTFFVAGRGGPMSMWARRVDNSSTSGCGLRLVTADEARAFMENAGCDEEDFEAVGLPVAEG